MSDRNKEFWFGPAFLAGACASAAGLLGLREKHPGIIFCTVFLFAVFCAGVLLFVWIMSPPRPRTSADETRAAAPAGFIAGLLTGNFINHEKREQQRPPEA